MEEEDEFEEDSIENESSHISKPYVLLKPVKVTPPSLDSFPVLVIKDPTTELNFIWEEFPECDREIGMAIDLETLGNKCHDLNSTVVMASMCDSRGAFAIDFKESHEDTWITLLEGLYENNVPLCGHNILFDAGYMFRDSNNIIPAQDTFSLSKGLWHNWKWCTFAAAKHLANEGWINQRWSLGSLCEDLLGVKEGKDTQVYKWLVENGYTKSKPNKTILEKVTTSGWESLSLEEQHNLIKKADKGKLGLVPGKILGRYAAFDAWNTYNLMRFVLKPTIDRFHAYPEYHNIHFINLVQLLIMQQLGGILMDVPNLTKYRDKLVQDKINVTREFLEYPTISPLIQEFEDYVVNGIRREEPNKFKQVKELKEPVKYRKDGKVSAAYEKYIQQKLIRDNTPPEITQAWIKWNDKLELALKELHFNPFSQDDLRWLFYDRLQYPIIVYTNNKDNPRPAVDGDARRGFGEEGKLYDKLADISKELGYVEKCLDTINKETGTLHPQWKAPGTLTGRLAGSGGVNIQQVPKTVGYLENWIARPGTRWICWDFSALEMVVMAELTRDKTLWSLYSPEAKPTDVYLFNGSNLPIIGPKIRASGYNPNNPTPESVAKAKKECKAERQISKIITLSAAYGCGPSKLRMSLAVEGIKISLEEARALHSGYWELYKGVKEYERFLQIQWENNRGWVMSGIGIPQCADPIKQKDLVNSNCQETGHNILMIMLTIVRNKLEKEGIPHHWIIADWHDAMYLELLEKDVDIVSDIMDNYCVQELHRQLGGGVLLKGAANIVTDLAEDKCPDDYYVLHPERKH